MTTIGTACRQVEVAIRALEAKAAVLSRELGVRQTRGAFSTLSTCVSVSATARRNGRVREKSVRNWQCPSHRSAAPHSHKCSSEPEEMEKMEGKKKGVRTLRRLKTDDRAAALPFPFGITGRRASERVKGPKAETAKTANKLREM